MKKAIVSLATAAALLLTTGAALAQPGRYGRGNGRGPCCPQRQQCPNHPNCKCPCGQNQPSQEQKPAPAKPAPGAPGK
jgi:hypothetical protein